MNAANMTPVKDAPTTTVPALSEIVCPLEPPEFVQLHGAKFGCELGQCGACTVIVGDKAMFSCLIPVSSIGTRAVRTIESLGTAAHPGPLQKSFVDHQAAQCGYCIAGMIMRAQALLDRTPRPTERELIEHMEPNLCRCGTHTRILAAIREVAHLPASDAAPTPPHSAASHGGTQ